jgi:hypothetical protein
MYVVGSGGCGCDGWFCIAGSDGTLANLVEVANMYIVRITTPR